MGDDLIEMDSLFHRLGATTERLDHLLFSSESALCEHSAHDGDILQDGLKEYFYVMIHTKDEHGHDHRDVNQNSEAIVPPTPLVINHRT